MDPARIREAFDILKPLCDEFLKNPQEQVLQSIRSRCRSIPNDVLQEVHAFVLFPFTVHLSNVLLRPKVNLLMSSVDVMHEILSRTHVESLEQYHKFFSVFIFQLFDRDTATTVAAVDEDYVLIIVKSITQVTLRIPKAMRLKLYTRTTAPQLGQGIFLCIQIAKTEKYKALRMAAIHSIMALSSVHESLIDELHSPMLNPTLGKCVGDVLMFFLPGLVGGLLEVATGDSNQSHVLTCLAIKAISKIICLVMMDRERSNDPCMSEKEFLKLIQTQKTTSAPPSIEENDPFGRKLRAQGHDGMVEHLQKAKRNKEWYRAAGEKLSILMKLLMPLQYHSHERVRIEMAIMCGEIVTYCPKNMYSSLKYILAILVPLTGDICPEVVAASKVPLDLFINSNSSYNGKQLSVIFEENFNNVVTKLPRLLNYLDTSLRQCGLHLLSGYTRLMTDPGSTPQKMTQILSSTYFLNRFTLVLVEAFKMECNGIKLSEEFAVRDVESQASDKCPWTIFTYLQTEYSLTCAYETLELLGGSESVEIMIDYLLEQFRENTDCKKEIILLLNEIVSAPCKDVTTKEHLIKDVISTYIELENWYLPTVVRNKSKTPGKDETLDVTVYNPREWIKDRTPGLYEGATEIRYTDVSYKSTVEQDDDDADGDTDSCRTLAEAKNNIVKICLMTEGVGKIANVLGVKFQPYLLKTLYLVLERAGSGNELIHMAGMKSLNYITQACNLNSITELIKENADYFTHHVNLKLRKIADNAGVLDVLLVVMRYSETGVLPCLYDIVSNVLNQCPSHHQKNMILFLRLFYTFIKYIRSRFPPEESNPSEIENMPEKLEELSIACKILEYEKNRKVTCDDDLNEANQTAEEMFLEDLKKKQENLEDVYAESANQDKSDVKIQPIHVAMVVSVLKRTLNYIPSSDWDQKIMAIEIIKEGVLIIRNWEEDLLPLVHLVWSPLVIRFKEISQPVIINRCFLLLVTLAIVSKDFIRVRTLKEVMPSLCEYLQKTAKDSYMKDIGSSYRYTQAYKLQLTLLNGLGQLCRSLGIQEKNMYDIMCATDVYLSCKQPKPLQEACFELFKTFMIYDPAGCWFHLKGLWNPEKDLVCPKMDGGMDPLPDYNCAVAKNMDYSGNVMRLLDAFNKI